MSTISVLEQAQQCQKADSLVTMTPWVVQGIVYELITRFFQTNPMSTMGYPLNLKYDPDKLKSDIFVDIAYNYNASAANKRPSVFVSRGDCAVSGLTMGHKLPGDAETKVIGPTAGSYTYRHLMNKLAINVAVIAAPIAMVEILADYVAQAFISFQQEIQWDFGFRLFRLREISKPQIYVEAKEYFVVNLTIEVVYDSGWTLRRDDLPLKSVSIALFDAISAQSQLN